jgi:Ca2+-binding EF-hand superfamily protein
MKRRIPWALPALLALTLAVPAAQDRGEKPNEKTKAKADETYSIVYIGDDKPLLIRLHVLNDGQALEGRWNKFIDQVFKYLDVNGDGVLDKKEAERTPPPSVLLGANQLGIRTLVVGLDRAEPRSLMSQLDTNKDGKVTRDELAAYYRRNGAGPFQYGGPRSATRIRGVGDAVIAFDSGTDGGSNADALNEVLFNLLDTNKDGKLSKEELARAPEILMKLDANDDEIVSLAELRGNAGRGNVVAPGVARVRAFDPDGRLMGSGIGNSNFVLITPGEPSPELARAMLARYGRKGDGAPKKRLTRKDIGLDKESFKLLDKDGDDELDAEELARFGDRKPDLALNVQVGEKPDADKAFGLADVDGKPSPYAKMVKKGTRGTMSLDLGNVQIDLRQGQEDGGNGLRFVVDVKQQYLQAFKELDTDKVGYLEKAKLGRSIFTAVFDLMDRDGDGKLYEKEVIAYLDAIEGLQKAARKACVTMSVSDQGQGLFDLIDTDHDGRLSLREMRNMVKLIDQLDKDGDGCISKNEIPRRYAVSFRQGSAQGDDLNRQFVVIVNGLANNASPPVPERKEGPLWFRKMDRNRDGDVSRREFLGSDEEFKAIDEDGDGLISAEEAERYDRKHRKATEESTTPSRRPKER